MSNVYNIRGIGLVDSDLRLIRKPSGTFKRHADRLRGRKALAKNEIMALCWALNGSKRVDLTDFERAKLRELVECKDARPITRELTKVGLEWLRRIGFKKNGEPRQSKSQPFGDRELDIIRNFARFAWVGIYNTQEHFGNYNGAKSYTPIWRVYAKDGTSFDYAVAGGYGGFDVVIL